MQKLYQLSSTFCLRVMTSPSLNPSSPAFSGSKSYKAWADGWDRLVGVELGVYLLGEATPELKPELKAEAP